MPTYLFKIGTPDGQILDREIRAESLATAKEELSRQGLHVFKVSRRSLDLGRFFRGRKAVSTEKFLVFNQQLLALVRAGLPIVQSFEIMMERQENPRFRQILIDIRDKIKSGVALSDAFGSYGSLFPPIYSTSIRAGERSGDLEGVIRRFLRYQKLLVGLRKKVITATIYPTVLVGMMGVMIFIMLTTVIPKFTEFYQGFDAELPAMTKALIALSLFIRSNLLMALAAAVIFGIMARSWLATSIGRTQFDHYRLRIPYIGGILHRFAILQFTQSLGTLLGGGTPMVPAIEIAAQSVTNRYVAAKIADMAQKVREGEPLWKSLDATHVVSDLAIEMIKVGESTGALVEMLQHTSEFYDEEIEESLSRMMALIEPVVLVVLGTVIAVLLYSFYLPLLQLTKVENG